MEKRIIAIIISLATFVGMLVTGTYIEAMVTKSEARIEQLKEEHQQEIEQLESEYEKSASARIDDVQEALAEVEEKYSALEAEYFVLETKYSALEAEYFVLETKYVSLKERCQKANSSEVADHDIPPTDDTPPIAKEPQEPDGQESPKQNSEPGDFIWANSSYLRTSSTEPIHTAQNDTEFEACFEFGPELIEACQKSKDVSVRITVPKYVPRNWDRSINVDIEMGDGTCYHGFVNVYAVDDIELSQGCAMRPSFSGDGLFIVGLYAGMPSPSPSPQFNDGVSLGDGFSYHYTYRTW